MPDAKSVVVIGAGISGLVLAYQLVMEGHRVQVLEKSRGIGGRVSTRRDGEVRYDHGAPLLFAPSKQSALTLKVLEAERVLARDGDGWVGIPSMNALPRWFADCVTVHSERTAHALSRTANGWSVQLLENGSVDADVVVLAIPAPQAVALLRRSTPDVIAVTSSMHEPLAQVIMSPCWSIMFALANSTADRDVTPASLAALGDDHLRLYAQHTRPQRSAHPAWVAQAGSVWSTTHLEENASAIEARVSNALVTARPGVSLSFLRAHRWRYANVTRGLEAPMLWDAEHCIGACGDWAGMLPEYEDAAGDGRYGIMRAYASGSALADAIAPTSVVDST